MQSNAIDAKEKTIFARKLIFTKRKKSIVIMQPTQKVGCRVHAGTGLMLVSLCGNVSRRCIITELSPRLYCYYNTSNFSLGLGKHTSFLTFNTPLENDGKDEYLRGCFCMGTGMEIGCHDKTGELYQHGNECLCNTDYCNAKDYDEIHEMHKNSTKIPPSGGTRMLPISILIAYLSVGCAL